MTHDQSDAELTGIFAEVPHSAQAPPIAQALPITQIPPVHGGQTPPVGRGKPEPPVRLDAESRRRIGRNLRLLYGDVLSQPLPARFEALLADLTARNDTGDAS